MDQSVVLHNVYVMALCSWMPSLVLGLVGFIQKNHLIVRAPKLRLNYPFARWTTKHWYAASIWVGAFSFFILVAVQHVIRSFDIVLLSVGPVLLIIAGAIALFVEHFKLAEVYENHAKIIKVVTVASAIAVGYVANMLANASIANYTSTNAANFPDAQRVITTVVSLGLWVFAAVVISCLAYFLIVCITLVKIVNEELILEKQRRYKACMVGQSPKMLGHHNTELPVLFTLLFAAAVTVVAPMIYLQQMEVSKVEGVVKELLVMSSFQLSPELCGVAPPDGSAMSLLPFHQAAIAIPDDQLAYTFKIVKCTRKFAELPGTVEE